MLLCKDKQKKTGKISQVLSDKIKMDKEESSKRPNKNKIQLFKNADTLRQHDKAKISQN